MQTSVSICWILYRHENDESKPLHPSIFCAVPARIKGCSGQTIKAYRDTFKLFLPFAADYHGVKIKSLTVDHLTSDVILDFLDHLQSQRGNQASTRNQRLAAIKSLAKMIRFMVPGKRKIADMIRAIPQKRMQRPLIGFLYPDEI